LLLLKAWTPAHVFVIFWGILLMRYRRDSVFLALILSCCMGAAAQAVAPLAPSESIQNLNNVKAQLRAYHDCTRPTVCYQHDLDVQADRAIAFLHRRVLHPSTEEKLALILDIDETTLSNYDEMAGADFAYDSARFNAWVDSAQAPAIAGTLRLYKEAQRLGVAVFFLTGRTESQRAVTEQNLRNVGFDNWQQLILRQTDEESTSALDYKSAARGRIAASGYKIILNVGDQWSDLRGKPLAEYSVKYPDPFYFLK
jgi:acid phosphatase